MFDLNLINEINKKGFKDIFIESVDHAALISWDHIFDINKGIFAPRLFHHF